MKTKLLLLIFFLSKGISTNAQSNVTMLKPIPLNETGIISHLMLVKQTSEYKTAFFINKWTSELLDLKTQLDSAKKKSDDTVINELIVQIDSTQRLINTISFEYTRLQIAYDQIILQLDYVINSRNRALFFKRLNRRFRIQSNASSKKFRGSKHIQIYLTNLKTCYFEFEKFQNNLSNYQHQSIAESGITPFTKKLNTKSDSGSLIAPVEAISAVLGVIDTTVGIYTAIDDLNGKKVDDVSKLLQACRFKSVSDLQTPPKKEVKEEEKKEDDKKEDK